MFGLAIGNLQDKLSSSDVDRVREMRNPPEFEPGFEDTSMSDGFESLFGSDDDDMNIDGGFGSDALGFGGDTLGFGSDTSGFGQSGFGQSAFNPYGQGGFGQNIFGQQQVQQQQASQPDRLDKLIDGSIDVSVSVGKIILEVFKSVKNRTSDDLGYLSTNLIITGGCLCAFSIASIIIGSIAGASAFSGLAYQLLYSGVWVLMTGIGGIYFSAYKINTSGRGASLGIQDIQDLSEIEEDDATEDYEENIGDILDDLFSDIDDIDFEEDEEEFDSEEPPDSGLDASAVYWGENDSESNDNNLPNFGDTKSNTLDLEKELDSVRDNQVLSRRILFDTFKSFFPKNQPDFADRVEIERDSDEFATLETICLKGLSNILKCELEDVKSELDRAYETFFSYELKLKRVRGMNKLEDLAREIEAYMKSSVSDTSVYASVDIEGDFYKITVAKGESAVVTFGDIFTQKYACDFFIDEGNKLPMITGIDELGNVILHDAKGIDSMLVAGKPRSGKSWYLESILVGLSAFNTPEDVVFVIVDPKESNLFKTFALFPHVLGLHNDEPILEIMDDIIENEAPRRRGMLADNRCDDIWELRNKGIRLPVLYLVIDEYITVRNNLGSRDKELDLKLQTIISQLPSLGIRVLFVPHRATGVVNKTNRTMLNFTACVRGDIEDVKDTLGISKWTRALTKPGDIALKASTMQTGIYVRGAAVSTSDSMNTDIMRAIAKAFYKMGVYMPESALQVAANRDEEYIRGELLTDGKKIQFSTLDLDN